MASSRSLTTLLRHSFAAAWLAILALTCSGIEQNQLSSNVMAASAAEAGVAVAGPSTVAPCPLHQTGGHTHKGHADCAICGSLAALTAVTLPVVVLPPAPAALSSPACATIPTTVAVSRTSSPYLSRAPPHGV